MIGPIGLPSEQVQAEAGVDAELDQGMDAALDEGVDAVADAAADQGQDRPPPPDLGLDAERDLGADVSDAAPDQAVDAAPPPDPGRYAGRWHLYGFSQRGEAVVLIEGVLRIEDDGQARLETMDAEVVGQPEFTVERGQRTMLQANFFPVAGLVTGTLDPVTGVGVFVNDQGDGNPLPTFIMAARQTGQRINLPSSGIYVHALSTPFGDGEVGVLSEISELYSELDRRAVSGEVRQMQTLQRANHPALRHRLFIAEVDHDRILSPLPGSVGAVGLYRQAEIGVGLSLIWNTASPAEVRAGPSFCAGFRNEGGTLQTEAERADFEAEGVRWQSGRVATIARNPGLLTVESAETFLGTSVGLGIVDPTDRIFVLLPARLNPSLVHWGFGICVALDEEVDPEADAGGAP